MANDLFLIVMFISLITSFMFLLSALWRLVKREEWESEAKKVVFFLGLTCIFFVLFGLTIL